MINHHLCQIISLYEKVNDKLKKCRLTWALSQLLSQAVVFLPLVIAFFSPEIVFEKYIKKRLHISKLVKYEGK